MEDNENQPAEVAEEEVTKLSREEILSISRAENKHGDERDTQVYFRSMQIAYSIGVILISIVIFVYTFLDNGMPTELMIVYMGMAGSSGIYAGVKSTKHRKLFLASGIICLITFVFFVVFWILQLCGVI